MMNRWKALRYLILLILLIIFVYTFYPHIGDFKSLYQIRDSLNYIWIIIGILSQASQYLDDGYFTRKILKILHFNIKLSDTIQVAAVDVFATHLFPIGQFGPLASNLYFYRKLGLDTQAVVFFNIVMSIVGVAVLIALFLFSSITIPNKTFPFPVHIYLLTTLFILFMLFLGILFLAFKVVKIQKNLEKFLKKFKWFISFKENFAHLRRYREFLSEKRGKFFAFAVTKSLLYYLADILTLLTCFLAFHTFPSISLVIFAYILSQVAGAITLIPAGIGSTDITLGVIFLSTGIPSGIVVGVIILYRLLSFVLPIPLGAASYYSLKNKLK